MSRHFCIALRPTLRGTHLHISRSANRNFARFGRPAETRNWKKIDVPSVDVVQRSGVLTSSGVPNGVSFGNEITGWRVRPWVSKREMGIEPATSSFGNWRSIEYKRLQRLFRSLLLKKFSSKFTARPQLTS
jgi:hypothetical protein